MMSLPKRAYVSLVSKMPNAGKLTSAKSDVSRVAAELALARLVHPVLPRHVQASDLRERVDPGSSVLLTCGNPASMADLRSTAARRDIRFELEEW